MKLAMKMCTGLSCIGVVMSLLLLASVEAYAQDYPGQPQTVSDGSPYTPAQLDQMLAPIALYPDPLLAQILMAATYPLQIVEADRWLQENDNAGLQGSDLATALAQQPWDPSVKSLVPFPQILRMMDAHIGWTSELGDAFLADQAAVMNAVQRLRRLAQANGTLTSSQQQLISDQDSIISILPPSPEIVYVPVYDPDIVFGVWPYPNYPPYYFPGFFNVPVIGGVGIGWFVIVINRPLWGWGQWDWRRHRIDIDRNRFNALHARGLRIHSRVWHHEGPVRRGRAGTFSRHPTGRETVEKQRMLRGYAPSQGTLSILPSPYKQTPRTNRVTLGRTTQPPRTSRSSPGRVAQPPRTSRSSPGRVTRPPRMLGTFPGRGAQPPRTFRRTPSYPRSSVPPAYESFGHGSDIRAQDERGRASHRSMRNLMPRRGGGRQPSMPIPVRRRR